MAQFPANIDLSSLDGTIGFRLSGESGGSGWSVASAGDVNGDGFVDLIVGAPGVSASYVVFGKASGFAANVDLSSLDGTNGFKLSRHFLTGPVGHSVASDDVNGDGFADLIIGFVNRGGYVVFGKGSGHAADIDLLRVSEFGDIDGFRVFGETLDDGSGYSVASAGDVNGDGIADLIFGAPYGDPNGTDSGASFVFFGKAPGSNSTLSPSSLDGSNGFRLNGLAANDRAGHSVASAGDVNGDGFDDLIIGAPFANGSHQDSGTSYVVFGKASGFAASVDLASLDGSNGFKLNGVAGNVRSGSSVASAGDVNGDGFDDMIVGAPLASPHGQFSGAAYVVFGKASGFDVNVNLRTLDGRNGFRLSGVAEKDYSGYSVASAGDVNGDGFDDVIVGARRADPHGTSSGATYVVFGKAGASGFAANIDLSSLDGTNGFKLSGVAVENQSGWSVASAGDINGDGLDDLIVGSRAGAGYVIYGRGPDTAVVRVGTVASQTLVGGAFDDALSGLDGDDRLFGNGGVDTLKGGDGDDVLDGGAGADTLIGNAGHDTARYLLAGAGVTVSLAVTGAQDTGGAGIDRLQGIESVLGSVFDDALTGSRLDNRLDGVAGNDELRGGEGNDRLDGGNGDDRLVGGLGDDLLDGGAGDDTLIGNPGLDTASYVSSGVGVTVSLAILGAQDTGGAGIDTLQGIENAVGSAYDDVLTGSDLDNRLDGGRSRDFLYGGAGADVLIGGDDGNDVLWGEQGNDRLEGGDEIDYLDGGTGADLMMGGGGYDRYFVDNVLDVVVDTGGGGLVSTSVSFALTENSGSLAVTGLGTADLTLTGNDYVNQITGSQGNDTLDGDGGDDLLRGFAGDDTLLGGDNDDRLEGSTGNDRLEGGAGNDYLEGSTGADVMIGGDGDDEYFVDNVLDVVEEETGGGYDRIFTSASVTLTATQAIEFLEGDGYAYLTLTGNQNANSIWGDFGNDTLSGAGGNDSIRGKYGNDTLFGGKGNDRLEGGAGADLFRYRLGDGNDRFTDFFGAAGDRVALVNVTVSQLVNNIATLSDGSTLTAQSGYAWATSDFVTG